MKHQEDVKNASKAMQGLLCKLYNSISTHSTFNINIFYLLKHNIEVLKVTEKLKHW